MIDPGFLASLASIIWLDVVLSGDNALVIGLAASTLREELRRRAILFGLILATVIRIASSAAATYLLQLPGLLLAGGIALLWVSWRLFEELRKPEEEPVNPHAPIATGIAVPDGSLTRALVAITVADVSMSIDNVLAVAAIARDHVGLLVFGLALSIGLMGLAAGLIVKLLLKYRWISYVGVALLVYIGGHMVYEGYPDLARLPELFGSRA